MLPAAPGGSRAVAKPAPAKPPAKPAAKPVAAANGGRVVRSAAGARRYGVAVGQVYTSEGGGQTALGRGMTGSRTKSAQDRLVALGLLAPTSGKNGGKDGLFGPKTEAALREFQKQRGLPVTGKLDTRTGVMLDKAGNAAKPAAAHAGPKAHAGRTAHHRAGRGQTAAVAAPPLHVPPNLPPHLADLLSRMTEPQRQQVLTRAQEILNAAQGKPKAPAAKH